MYVICGFVINKRTGRTLEENLDIVSTLLHRIQGFWKDSFVSNLRKEETLVPTLYSLHPIPVPCVLDSRGEDLEVAESAW